MSGHIVLIGLSGSGKSTVGALLAESLHRPLYDTDALLAARADQPVPALLRAGEARFRALEEEVVGQACAAPKGIIATGGGAVLSARNRDLLREGNTVVWLRAPTAALVARLFDEGRATRNEGGDAPRRGEREGARSEGDHLQQRGGRTSDEREQRPQRGEERPLLAGDPATRLAALAREREALYAACAHIIIETEGLTAHAVARRILDLMAGG